MLCQRLVFQIKCFWCDFGASDFCRSLKFAASKTTSYNINAISKFLVILHLNNAETSFTSAPLTNTETLECHVLKFPNCVPRLVWSLVAFRGLYFSSSVFLWTPHVLQVSIFENLFRSTFRGTRNVSSTYFIQLLQHILRTNVSLESSRRRSQLLKFIAPRNRGGSQLPSGLTKLLRCLRKLTGRKSSAPTTDTCYYPHIYLPLHPLPTRQFKLTFGELIPRFRNVFFFKVNVLLWRVSMKSLTFS